MGKKRKDVPATKGEAEVLDTLKRADSLRSKRRYSEALDILLNELDKGVLRGSIYYRIGNVHYDAGREDLAEYAYRRAIECEPDHANAHFNLSTIYRRRGDVQKSVMLLRKAHLLEIERGASWPRGKSLSTEEQKWARAIALKQFVIAFAILSVVLSSLYLLVCYLWK